MKCKSCNKKEAIKYSKYSTGEFCSRECARTYSSKFRTEESYERASEKLRGRKQSTERILKTSGKNNGRYNCNISDEERNRRKSARPLCEKKGDKKICLSCGVEISNENKKKYCNLCSSFIQYKNLFNKLGVLQKNLQVSNQNALILLSKEYFTNKKALIQIRNEYGIMYNTTHFFFKKNGINLRTTSKSLRLAFVEGRAIPNVNTKYQTGYHTTWYGKEVYYRSSYELRMMDVLDERKEMYFYETLRIEYEFEGEKSIHVTDFYLPERNLVIEMKGEWFQKRDRDKLEAKKKAVLSEGYYHIMLGKKELEQYEKGKQL